MTEERNESEFTREQAVGIQSLALAIQTLREGFLRFDKDNQPDQIRSFVLVTAAAYRDFINDRAISRMQIDRLKNDPEK